MDFKKMELPELPTLPEVMARVLESANDPDTSAEKLAAVIEKDPAISVRVLRMANSVFFSRGKPADSVQRAIVVVGFEAVKTVALTTSVFDALSSKNAAGIDAKDFWFHSLGTATASKQLSEMVDAAAGPSWFTAGLLHDIGKYILAIMLGTDYRKAVQISEKELVPLRDVEDREFGVNHTQIGGWVARKWQFPELFADVMTSIYQLDSYHGPYAREVAAVAVADRMVQEIGLGKAGEGVLPSLPGAVLQHLDIDLAGLDEFKIRLKETVQEVANNYRILAGQAPPPRNRRRPS